MKRETQPQNLEKVKAVCDVDGHWYIIPNDLEQKFEELMDKAELNDEVCYEFEELFGQYRTGGSLNLVQLYAEI